MKFWSVAIVVAAALIGLTLTDTNEYFFFAGFVVLQFVVIATAWNILGSMFFLHGDGHMVLEWIDIAKVGIVAAVLFLTHWFMRNTSVRDLAHQLPWWMLGFAWAFMLILLIIAQGSGEQFIYFQF